MNPAEVRLTEGRLTERDGGGVQFALVAPRTIDNATSIEATLDRVNAATVIAALQMTGQATPATLMNTQADVSGEIKVKGIPDAMSGQADLRFGPGRLAGEPLEGLTAKATFIGSQVTVDSVDARLVAGRIAGSWTYNITIGEWNG
jgi:hypothetical protein